MKYALGNMLNSAVSGLDPDAKAYIAAVEAADAQALESGVKVAINNFVKGCKSDAIWDAIKASCIMAGARTLSGALVPLKGTAPTNFNFVSGDYTRQTGLVGNGTTKYLNSNRNNNADPQDNQHMSVYVSAIGSNFFLGLNDQLSTGANSLAVAVVRSRNLTGVSWTSGLGFNGVSRSNSSGFIGRSQSSNQILTSVSQTPQNSNILIMRGNTGVVAYGSHRLSFYSIGESIDIAALDSRVSTLMSNLTAAIP
jgi:hypothetical protein